MGVSFFAIMDDGFILHDKCREAYFEHAYMQFQEYLRKLETCAFANVAYGRTDDHMFGLKDACNDSQNHMPPCQLVRAPRELCAFLTCAAALGLEGTLGELRSPITPCQGTEFPGPSSFSQYPAALPARPRFGQNL